VSDVPAERDEAWMAVALGEAAAAGAAGDVPVGAVLVSADGAELGRGRNRREQHGDPTAHAELEALRSAFAGAGAGWRREGSTLYVTLEPCPMCMGAVLLARVERLVYGASDPKAGAASSLYRLGEDARLNHRVAVRGGVMQGRCAGILREFFRNLRSRGG
jgi:tRNA(adenine34) deaminase